MVGISKRRFHLKKAREARRLSQHYKDQLASLHLEAPIQLHFGYSTVPPLNIKSPPILDDDEQPSAAASRLINTTNCQSNATTTGYIDIDKNNSQSVSKCSIGINKINKYLPSCLICHDRYVTHEQPRGGDTPAFVSRLPSSVAPSFIKALGQLILSTSLSSSESEALLSQMEKSLYCSNCMKELREIAVITEQFDKLNYWLGVRRVQMITQLQNPNVQPKGYCGSSVGGLRAKLIKNLQAPCYLKASEIITKKTSSMAATTTKTYPTASSSRPPPKSKASKQSYPLRAVPIPMINKNTRPKRGVGVGLERRRKHKRQELEEEIWEHVQVKVENEEEEAEEDVEIMDHQDDDDDDYRMDPLDPGPESMLTDHYDDDDEDVKMAPLVKIIPPSTTTTPPPPQQQQPTQILLIQVVKCTVCTELFMNQAQLDEHEEIEHPPPSPPLLPCKCNLCGEMYNYKSILNHLKTEHYKKKDPGPQKHEETHQDPTSNKYDDGNEDSNTNGGGKDQELLPQCPACGKHVKDLSFHTFLHETSFSCDACPQLPSSSSSSSSIFSSYTSYRRHLTTAHPELGSHQCEDCGTTFKNAGSLQHHKSRKHNQDFQHSCTRCQTRFRKESELRKHMQYVHDKTCSICDAKFSRSDGLKKHLALHADGEVQRKYKCNQCSKLFRTRCKLKDHVDAIHGLNKEAYVCETCGKGFPIQGYLYVHLRSHESPEEKEARRLKAKVAAEARKLSGKPVLIAKGRPRLRPIKQGSKKRKATTEEAIISDNIEAASFRLIEDPSSSLYN